MIKHLILPILICLFATSAIAKDPRCIGLPMEALIDATQGYIEFCVTDTWIDGSSLPSEANGVMECKMDIADVQVYTQAGLSPGDLVRVIVSNTTNSESVKINCDMRTDSVVVGGTAHTGIAIFPGASVGPVTRPETL